jgi:hypothetical protein
MLATITTPIVLAPTPIITTPIVTIIVPTITTTIVLAPIAPPSTLGLSMVHYIIS